MLQVEPITLVGHCVSQPFLFHLKVPAPQAFSQGTVDVEPPVADKVLLLEQGSIGTEEAVLC